MSRLRRKIEVDAKAPQLLLTERGADPLSTNRPLMSDCICLGLSDICPSRKTDATRDTGLRAGVG
jgi:hypothetical protein